MKWCYALSFFLSSPKPPSKQHSHAVCATPSPISNLAFPFLTSPFFLSRITFSRAKDLATKFKILDLLYPLFTDDPSMFLCSSGPSANGGPINNDSTLSNSSSNGVPVTSDTASVETAQTSSTVKSLAHTSTNLPPPMPYKPTDSYNSMMSSSWMDQRSYQQQQSLPGINSSDGGTSSL
ncbi:hypothetical protein BDB00DRAFT_836938 [Zychaea mexicana]|uniref:uncharacterized protein n=1 Tax=Zychaea mexicana TaxID=64656 RepID=UPI0022FDB2B2|nr:uncharacterized protein BDB00DRAFT_836938 [Zychaea mexicana]KAI9490685.1 hypothetical protein BDB00DRAFT_836938 [Zychaea mexicana]